MSGIQEAKYIQVIWQDKTTARKVVESRDALSLKSIGENTLEVNVISYSLIDDGRAGQFAIRLDSRSIDVPRVELVSGASMELLPVNDPVTGICWWVEGKTWDNKRGHWLSDIYRGVGEVRITVGAQICRVKISTSTFTHQELERYLKDFQTDFWELILDDNSYISGAAKLNRQSLLDEITMRAIEKFIECVELVLKTPKVELREVQRLKLRKEVRPVPRTFMEISTHGNTRMLTSRAYQESLDLPENRYAHFALWKVYQITKVLCTVAASQTYALKRNLEKLQQRLSSFSDVRIINEEAVRHHLKDKEDAIKNEFDQNNILSERIRSGQPIAKRNPRAQQISFLQVRLGKKADKISGVPFFGAVRSKETKPWKDFRDQNGYTTIDFGSFGDIMYTGSDYEIQGEIFYTETTSTNNKTRHNFELFSVTSIKLINSIKIEKIAQSLIKSKKEVDILERGGWQRPLNPDEAAQQKKEAASIESNINLIKAKEENLALLVKELAPKLPALRAALNILKKEKVKMDARFPNSMTYVQNPAYQGIHLTFSKIKEGSGINEDEILLAMDRIEEIGLVNISMLYERWCLLQVIKVLTKLQYRPEQGWKKKLITQILDHGHNVAINFMNTDLRRKVTLHYEKELDNGRRPDFMLDVSANYNGGKTTTVKRFVMDAKFYQDINNERHGGLCQIINELYNGKDYAEGGNNAVFILHPSPRSAPSRATPQEWSRDNFYGEVRLFDWDNLPPNHRYGGIFLSPIANEIYLDSLQRAIGMFLQYGMENNAETDGENGALPEYELFCLVCGSSKLTCRQSPKNAKAWWTTCNDCNHFTTYNYCGECRNRLIKNGEYWTYHAMEPLNPINIKCPSCGSMF